MREPRFSTSTADPLESWRDVGFAGAAWADGGDGNVLTGRTPGIPLDDRGRAQAGALAARLADVPLDAIITSPLDRCRETAEAIAAARESMLDMQHRAVSAVREWNAALGPRAVYLVCWPAM